MEESEKRNHFISQGIGLIIALIWFIGSIIWLCISPGWEAFVALITPLLGIIGFLGYFSTNYKSFVLRPNKNSLIQAKLIGQHSQERKDAFAKLRLDIKRGDQIWVLGTGVTSFLEASEDLESYYGAQIQILMLNNVLLKTDRNCQGDNGIKKIIETVCKGVVIDDEVGKEFLCDIERCHFLIQQEHFNNYYKKSNYHEKILDSQKKVKDAKALVRKKNWPGSIEARKFTTFFPLSMTVVNPNSHNNMRMIIEFVLPFTDQRLMLQYPQNKDNKQLYDMFVNFFSDTWNKHAVEI